MKTSKTILKNMNIFFLIKYEFSHKKDNVKIVDPQLV